MQYYPTHLPPPGPPVQVRGTEVQGTKLRNLVVSSCRYLPLYATAKTASTQVWGSAVYVTKVRTVVIFGSRASVARVERSRQGRQYRQRALKYSGTAIKGFAEA